MSYSLNPLQDDVYRIGCKLDRIDPVGEANPHTIFSVSGNGEYACLHVEEQSLSSRVGGAVKWLASRVADVDTHSQDIENTLTTGNALIASTNGQTKDWIATQKELIIDAVSGQKVNLNVLGKTDASLESIQTALRTAKFSLSTQAHSYHKMCRWGRVHKPGVDALVQNIRQLTALEQEVKQLRALVLLAQTTDGFLVDVEHCCQTEQRIAEQKHKPAFEHVKLRVWNPADPARVGLKALDTKAQKSKTQSIASTVSFGMLGGGAVDRTGGKVKELWRWGVNQAVGSEEDAKKELVIDFRGTAEAIGTASNSLFEGGEAIRVLFQEGGISGEQLQALRTFIPQVQARIQTSIEFFEKVLQTYESTSDSEKSYIVRLRLNAFRERSQQYSQLSNLLGVDPALAQGIEGEHVDPVPAIPEGNGGLPVPVNEDNDDGSGMDLLPDVDHLEEGDLEDGVIDQPEMNVVIGNIQVRDVQLADAIAKKRTTRQLATREMAHVLAGNARSLGRAMERINANAGHEIFSLITALDQHVDSSLMKHRNEANWASKTFASLINDWEQYGDDPQVGREVQAAFRQLFSNLMGDGQPTGWKRDMILAICSEASPFLYSLFDPE